MGPPSNPNGLRPARRCGEGCAGHFSSWFNCLAVRTSQTMHAFTSLCVPYKMRPAETEKAKAD